MSIISVINNERVVVFNNYPFSSDDDLLKSLEYLRSNPENRKSDTFINHYRIAKIAISHLSDISIEQRRMLFDFQKLILERGSSVEPINSSASLVPINSSAFLAPNHSNATLNPNDSSDLYILFVKTLGPPIPDHIKHLLLVGRRVINDHFPFTTHTRPLMERVMTSLEERLIGYWGTSIQHKTTFQFTPLHIKTIKCILVELTKFFSYYHSAKKGAEEQKIVLDHTNIAAHLQWQYLKAKNNLFPYFSQDKDRYTDTLYEKINELMTKFTEKSGDHAFALSFASMFVVQVLDKTFSPYCFAVIIDRLYLSNKMNDIHKLKKGTIDPSFKELKIPIKKFLDEVLALGKANGALQKSTTFISYNIEEIMLEIQRYIDPNSLFNVLSGIQNLLYNNEEQPIIPDLKKKSVDDKVLYIADIERKFGEKIYHQIISEIPSGLRNITLFMTDLDLFCKNLSTELFRAVESKAFLHMLATHFIQGIIDSIDESRVIG